MGSRFHLNMTMELGQSFARRDPSGFSAMRILYVNPSLGHHGSAPGTWGRQVVRELRNSGAEIVTIPADFSRSENENGVLKGLVTGIKKTVKAKLPYKLGVFLIEYFTLFRGLWRTIVYGLRVRVHHRRGDYDVVLGRVADYEWTPMVVAKILSLPLVLEVHSLFYLEREARGLGRSRWLQRIERIQWQRASRIWVNSENLRRLLNENGVPLESIGFIPFGIRIDELTPNPERNTAENIDVVFTGSFYLWHGLELLIRGFAALRPEFPHLYLRMVGDGMRRAAIEDLVRDLGVSDAVEFTGWLPRHEVFQILRASHIGTAPYLTIENFYFDPAKILEYMGAGLAVISTSQGRITSMIEDGVNGLLVTPGDVDEFTAALRRLAADKGLRIRLGAAAREKAAREFAWEKTATSVINLCEDTLSEVCSDKP